jgi:type 1 glutamine amidotransferase
MVGILMNSMPHYRSGSHRLWHTSGMNRLSISLLRGLLAVFVGAFAGSALAAPPRALIFSKTAGFRHDSIPTAVAALQRVAEEQGMHADATEDAAAFTPQNLARYRVVIFASTTGDVLDAAQQKAMQDFVDGGGGFMGVHSAADTEYDWPWYGQLVGAYFHSHPPGMQTTRVRFDRDGIAEQGREWKVTDEIYNYRDNPRKNVQVIATVDESDYTGGTMGDDHPIAWCRASAKGRAWYTGLGHDPGLYADPVFLRHLVSGLRYASGKSDEC